MPPKKLLKLTRDRVQANYQNASDIINHKVLSYNNKQILNHTNCAEYIMAMKLLQKRQQDQRASGEELEAGLASNFTQAVYSQSRELNLSVRNTFKRLRDLLNETKMVKNCEATNEMRATTTNVLPDASPWLMSRIDSVLQLLKERGDDMPIKELVEWCKYISSLKREIRYICSSLDVTFRYLKTVLFKINEFASESPENKAICQQVSTLNELISITDQSSAEQRNDFFMRDIRFWMTRKSNRYMQVRLENLHNIHTFPLIGAKTYIGADQHLLLLKEKYVRQNSTFSASSSAHDAHRHLHP
jgi:hypothetical protein